jgi:hypothetical protein
MISGEKVDPIIGKYEENILMLRYDDALFIRRDRLFG